MLLFFAAGVIAICAMILPGISGSFMLLLMGVYFDLLICINERQILMLAIFAAGAATGLLVFTRFLNYLLQKHGDATMSFMLGLVLGSLYAIWPFKSFGMVAGRRVDIANIMPDSFTANEGMTLLACLGGLLLVIIFMAIEKRQKASARCDDTA
jgi:putative membrane protein